jgi:type III pantothenate kinase
VTTIRKTRRPTTSAPALLAVDVGNTETTLGVFQDDHVVLHWRLRTTPRTSDEIGLVLRQLIAPEAIDLAGLPGVIGSVVPDVTADFARGLERLTGVVPVVVTAANVPSMAIRYRDPATVGADRLANAIAARERFGAPSIVVDLGTATTFDVVGPDGDFLGGAITLGLRVSADELFRRAARLGRVELAVPEQAIGQTSDDGMRSGLVLGHAAMVDGMVSRLLAELGGRAHVVATGGLASLMRELTGTIDSYEDDLTLHGLRLIHESVAHPETLAAWTKKQEKRQADRTRNAARIELEAPPHFDDEPEIDERDIHVVTGPERRSEPAPRPAATRTREPRPPRGQRGPSAPKAGARGERAERAPAKARTKRARSRAPEPVGVAVAVAPPPEPEPSATPNGSEGASGRKRRRGRRGGRRSRR